jgi:hypothetical protein
MAQPSQRRLWCAFSDDIDSVFSINCILNVDYIADAKEKIWTENPHKLAQTASYDLNLYSPVSPVKDTITKENLVLLDPRQQISSDFPQSKDPHTDIVIVRPQEQQQSETAQGTILHHKLLYYGDN